MVWLFVLVESIQTIHGRGTHVTVHMYYNSLMILCVCAHSMWAFRLSRQEKKKSSNKNVAACKYQFKWFTCWNSTKSTPSSNKQHSLTHSYTLSKVFERRNWFKWSTKKHVCKQTMRLAWIMQKMPCAHKIFKNNSNSNSSRNKQN